MAKKQATRANRGPARTAANKSKVKPKGARIREARVNPDDAWPPRGTAVDPTTTRAAVADRQDAADAARKRVEVVKANASKFIAAFVKDLPGDASVTGRFSRGPDDKGKWAAEYDIDDGWYADKMWKFRFEDHHLVEAVRADQPNQPGAFTPV